MTLVEHLYELRSRLFKAVLAIVLVAIISAFFYDELFALLSEPFFSQVRRLAEERDIQAELTINDVAGPLILRLKIALVSGLVLSSPIWLWQIWAFILPGLHHNERRWSTLFAFIAGPLFMGGVALGYFVLPKGIGILLDFTPVDVANLVEVDRYLNFILRMLLVFGVSFEIPLFIVLLNLAGVVSGRALGEHRSWIIVGVFVFAAVATPSTDPISMLFLALPLAGLFLISEVIARLVDRRRARREHSYDGYDDDEASPLTVRDGDDAGDHEDDDWDDDPDDDPDDTPVDRNDHA
ncbi:MAG: twin-arginine translocase subunit TatC [Actinomycetota bacterium]|jgi:sec-independent protein translocase protein TatC|nr:twin-arginine translocase subunit TatC [Nocardioidaceae bacterium]MDQ3592555.1 twin-arginine translocase subunit TatC [Actinomycetota bacterium]